MQRLLPTYILLLKEFNCVVISKIARIHTLGESSRKFDSSIVERSKSLRLHH